MNEPERLPTIVGYRVNSELIETPRTPDGVISSSIGTNGSWRLEEANKATPREGIVPTLSGREYTWVYDPGSSRIIQGTSYGGSTLWNHLAPVRDEQREGVWEGFRKHLNFTKADLQAYSRISANTDDPPLPRPVKTIGRVKFHPYKEGYGFMYGNCATLAICQAFDMKKPALNAICQALKMKENTYNESFEGESGMSFYECKKLINFLCGSYKWSCEYITNHSNVNYVQMLTLLNKGIYLSMFDIHLSYALNGEVYDDYFHGMKETALIKEKLTGWWKIN